MNKCDGCQCRDYELEQKDAKIELLTDIIVELKTGLAISKSISKTLSDYHNIQAM